MWNKKTLGIVITTQQTILLQQPSAGDIVTALHHNAHNKPSLHILSLASTLLKTSSASNWQVHCNDPTFLGKSRSLIFDKRPWLIQNEM